MAAAAAGTQTCNKTGFGCHTGHVAPPRHPNKVRNESYELGWSAGGFHSESYELRWSAGATLRNSFESREKEFLGWIALLQ